MRLKHCTNLYRRVPISVEKKKPPASKPYEVKAAMIRGKYTFFFAADLCVFEFFFSRRFFFCGGEVGKNARGTVPSWELFIYAIPMATFESMIFLFPRWDMLCYFSGEHHLVMNASCCRPVELEKK